MYCFITNDYLQERDLFFYIVRELFETVAGAIYLDILTLTARRYSRAFES
jgi:hypothetical protein